MQTMERETKVDGMPPMLSPRAMTVAGIGGTWNIIRVKSRCEKAIAADLLDNGFDYFLPLLKRKDHYNRVTYSPIEALRGFLFVSTPDAPPDGYFIPAMLQDYLVHHHAFYGFIPTTLAGQDQLVHELEMIYHGIVTRSIAEGSEIIKGIRCVVKSGPYRGQSGVIDHITRNGWAKIPITTLGQVVMLKVDVRDLEPA